MANHALSKSSSGPSRDEFAERYARYFGVRRMDLIRKSGRWMVEDHADGAYIHDTEGHRFLDFFVSSGVFNLGHRHPVIMAAMKHGLETYEFGNLLYFSEPKGRLAELLANTMPEGLEVVLPTVTGSEAVDLALKMAMGATGRKQIIHFDHTYHGCTGFSTALGPDAIRGWAGIENQNFNRIPYGDLAALRKVISGTTAAVIVEVVRSNFDGHDPGRKFFADLRHECDQTGALMIVDEVVTGLGRLGTLWGSEYQDVRPDIVTTAKGLSGGVFPMGAVVMKPEIIDCWGEHAYRSFSTYAWSSVGAHVACAAIEETQKLLPHANAAAARFEVALQDLLARHPDKVNAVRRMGLLFAIDLNPDKLRALEFATRMFHRGVVMPPAAISMPTSAVARLLPPLILNDDHIAEFMDKADDALGSFE